MTMRQRGRWPWYALALSALLISGSAVVPAPARDPAPAGAQPPASAPAPSSAPASPRAPAPSSAPARPSAPASTPSPVSTPAAAPAAAAPGICTSPDQPAVAAKLSRQITSALRGTEAVVGIAVKDSDEDFRCRYHQWQEFHSASVIKVITLGALLYQLQQAHESLGYDQDELATAMITQSDNDAQDTLWNEIGMPALQAFLNAARMNHTVLGTDDFWGLTEVNAHDELRLLQLLITHNPVLDAASRRYALTLMADVISWQRWGVSAGAPQDTTVHLKNGWLPDPDLWDINSIGDFTHNDHDYSIAILTSNDPDMAYGVDTVEAVARLINKALAAGDAGAAPAAEPFHNLLYLQRRFPG
jgi:beta-lactamase class A